MRAFGRCGILRRVERSHMTGGDASDAMDRLGEVVPGDDPLVGEVIDARHDSLFYGSEDGHSQVTRIGRCPNLVEDDQEE